MNRFYSLLQTIKSEHVFIQTHNFPDPDAVSSAFGLQKLLELNKISATICYKGDINRSLAARMIDVLNIELFNIDEINEMSIHDEIILVDSQKGNSNILDFVGRETICVDHHPTFQKETYLFEDIRPWVGACASIISEYYVENNIAIDKKVATALLVGIKIDTANLTRNVSDLDLDMFYYLYKRADLDLLKQCEENRLEFSDLKSYSYAINSIEVYGNVIFANPGVNCSESIIAHISDFMLSLSEVKFSIVYSIKEDGIRLSVRSKDNSYDAGEITNIALKGIGSGGGHDTMAGGQIRLNGENHTEEELGQKIIARFLDTINEIL
ncbi:MAG: DHH family phosphoesterase [Clostridiales bacterium]|nr:DHH family phosphoesterase [Clostridiales bacterium]